MNFIGPINGKPLTLVNLLSKKLPLNKLCKKYGIELLFVHGSLAQNKMKTLSDIDLAIQFSQKNSRNDVLKLITEFRKVIGRDEIDLAVLNGASALFKMQVLKKGKPIFIKNKRCLFEFRLKTINHYLATGHLRETFYGQMTKSILGKAS